MAQDPQDRPGEDAPAVDPTSSAEVGAAYGSAAAVASPATDAAPSDEESDGATIAMEGATAALPADTEEPPLPREGVSAPVTADGSAR
jgi:hypothetical protein